MANSLRRRVQERAGDMCEMRILRCCEQRGAFVHHVVPRQDGGTNDMDNLMWVCRPCHAVHHQQDNRRRAGGARV